MKGIGLKNKIVCDIGCGTGLVTLTSILLGADKVIAMDINEEALLYTQVAVENLLHTYPQFKTCNVEYKQFDIKDESSFMPNCNFAIMSDVTYYKDLARISANRAFEMMITGAEVLVTDPGRDNRNVFLETLKELSGTNGALPFSISKESMEIEPKEVTMSKLWAAQANFLQSKVKVHEVTQSNALPEYIDGYSLWL